MARYINGEIVSESESENPDVGKEILNYKEMSCYQKKKTVTEKRFFVMQFDVVRS